MNPIKMTAWMACPSWLLAAVSPERFYRRMVRRACWSVARSVRYGGGRVAHHARRIRATIASAPTLPSTGLDRPINETIPKADVASVRGWAARAAEFLPRRSAKITSLIDHDAPVRAVRDEFAAGIDDVRRLQK